MLGVGNLMGKYGQIHCKTTLFLLGRHVLLSLQQGTYVFLLGVGDLDAPAIGWAEHPVMVGLQPGTPDHLGSVSHADVGWLVLWGHGDVTGAQFLAVRQAQG